MKTQFHVILFCMLVISSQVVQSADLKLGYVNAPRLLEESPQAQQATSKMKEEFEPREKALIAAKNELDSMQTTLSRDGEFMAESNRKKLRIDMLAKQREFVRDEEALRQDIAIRRNDILGGLQDLIRDAIEVVGKTGKYDIIFYEGIAYGNPALDLTGRVLDELKKTSTSK